MDRTNIGASVKGALGIAFGGGWRRVGFAQDVMKLWACANQVQVVEAESSSK